MKKIYIKLFLWSVMIIGAISSLEAAPPPPKRVTPFLAGAEMQFRPINRAPQTSDTTYDTIEVRFIFYRDCKANTPAAYVPPVGDILPYFYISKSCCEFTFGSAIFNEALSFREASPLCKMNPGETTCVSSTSNMPGFRTEVYVDTVVLKCKGCDWVFGYQYCADDAGSNIFPPNYSSSGLGSALTQVNNAVRVAARFRSRIQAANTLSQQNDATEGWFYIESSYCNKLPDGIFTNVNPPRPRYKANTSANSAMNPFIFVCPGIARTFDLGYYDQDGHYLLFEKAAPFKMVEFGDPVCGSDRTLTELTFAGNANKDDPFGTTSMYNIDPNTGKMTIQANTIVGAYKTSIKISEFLDAAHTQKIHETYRDITLSVYSTPDVCNSSGVPFNLVFNPLVTEMTNCAIAPNRDKTVEACAGTTIRFKVSAESYSPIPGAAAYLAMDVDPVIENTGGGKDGVSGSTSNSTVPKTGWIYFKWSIPDTLPEGSYPIICQAQDCNDYNLGQTKIINIRVNKPTVLSWDYLGYTPGLTQNLVTIPKTKIAQDCGSGLPKVLTADNGQVDAIFQWYSLTSGVDVNQFNQGDRNQSLTISDNTIVNKVRVVSNQFCMNSDTLTILPVPSINPSLSTVSKDLCFGTPLYMTVTGLDPTKSYYYDWQGTSEFETPPNVLSNSAVGLLKKQNNTFNVFVVSADYCVYPLTVTKTLEGINPRDTLRTDKLFVCPYDTIRVALPYLTTAVCGQSQFSIPTGGMKLIDYPGEQSNIALTPKIFTASSTIDRSRTQFIYTADELKAAGFKPGLIKQLSFSVEGFQQPSTFNNVDVRVRCTDKYDLADNIFDSYSRDELDRNFILLGSYAAVNLKIGWIDFNFTGGFTWDGETNLLFDIQTSCNRACIGTAPTPPAFSDNMTSYVSIIGKYGTGKSNFEIAPIIASNLRPNIRFGYFDLDESAITFDWSKDITSLYKDSIPIYPPSNELITSTTRTPKIVTGVRDTFFARIKNGKCQNIDYAIADIDSNFRINILDSMATKCPGDTIQLLTKIDTPKMREMIVGCGYSNPTSDSCRSIDKMYYPYIGNPTSTAGTPKQSPFGSNTTVVGSTVTDKRMQIIYSALDLQADTNMKSGFIKSVIFYLSPNKLANSNSINNFSIKMKCISPNMEKFKNDTFDKINSFKEVYTAKSYTTVNGANIFNLNRPFGWDGVSGLMIEICWDNLPGSNYVSDIVRSTKYKYGVNKVLSMADNIGTNYGCAYNTGVRDSIRPNIGFEICKPTYIAPAVPSIINWIPNTYISNTQIDSPTIYNVNTTKYYVTLNYVDTNYKMKNIVCTVKDTFHSIVTKPKITFSPKPVISCQGSNTLVSAGVQGMPQMMYNYTWDNTQMGIDISRITSPNQIISPPNPQYYRVKVSSKSNPGCYNYDSVYVDIQNHSVMPEIGGKSSFCPGDSVKLSIPTGIGYRNAVWKLNGKIIDTGYSTMVTKPGSYIVEVDSGACHNVSIPKIVEMRPQTSFHFPQTQFTVCEGDSAYISFDKSQNIVNPMWNVGRSDVTIGVTQPGLYYLVNPTDQFGCKMIMLDSIRVNVISNPPFTVNGDSICISSNQTIRVEPVPYDPSATYTWTPVNISKPFLEVTTPGLYEVTRTKGNCTKKAYTTITLDSPGTLDLGKNQVLCCDEVITLDANPEGKKYRTYSWSTGSVSQIIQTAPNSSGKYVVEAVKHNGCKDTGSIYITSLCTNLKAKPEKQTINLGQTNNLLGSHMAVASTGIKYQWIPSASFNQVIHGDSLNAISKPADTGDIEYVLVMTVIDSTVMPPKPYCVENEVVRFKVIPNSLGLHNAFSPNGDGINDNFYPDIKGIVKIRDFKVYDRFGQLIHNNPNMPWDGKYQGQLQPLGVYVGLITYELEEPKKPMQVKSEKIVITLVR